MKQEYNFATYFRVLGMIFILLCHFTQESDNPYFKMSAQFFNIGVDMFIILSGFLFGIRGGQNESPVQWLKKRCKRIYIPYEFFVGILLTIHVFCGKNPFKLDWLMLILGMQGSSVGIQGAEQTWFITSILLCYLVTPIFGKFCFLSERKRCIVMCFLLMAPTILALIPPAYISTIYSPICWYGLAYFVGNTFKRIQINAKGVCSALLIMCLSFGCRLFVRMILDGTILYDRIVVSYTQVIAAFAMFYIVAFFTKLKPVGRAIEFVASISFEVYLYHYMFCVGPLRMFSLTDDWVINCCFVTIITVSLACLMKRVSDKIARVI